METKALLKNMIIYNVIESCENCPERVCVEFETTELFRTGDYVKLDFFGKRIFEVINVESNDYMKGILSVKAKEIGYKKNLLFRKKDINIFKMVGMKLEKPTEEEIMQVRINANLL